MIVQFCRTDFSKKRRALSFILCFRNHISTYANCSEDSEDEVETRSVDLTIVLLASIQLMRAKGSAACPQAGTDVRFLPFVPKFW